MPRKLRIEYPGAIYHVINRGNRREKIFRTDADYEMFLTALGEVCQKTGWEVHAYCLMKNHFHLVIETPQGNLVAGMKWLLGVYTKRFNIHYKTCGHLFAGRYKALVVDGSGTGYLRTVGDYVHLNPVRARLLAAEERLETFKWSSYPYYLMDSSKRPTWLRVDRIMAEKGIRKDTNAGRRVFGELMEKRREEEMLMDYRPVRHDWCLGSEEFRQDLLMAGSEKVGESHYGKDRQEIAEVKAEKIVKAGLKKLGWKEGVLKTRKKGDLSKVRIARELRQQTTMSLKWIANRLAMGSWTYVSNLLAQTA
jgi:putative transposase